MRIRRVSIDGYGRFTGCVLEFSAGLQVIVGPNEQGKSTLRSFIGDMLYGQKRSVSQRVYDVANELRMPWSNPDAYGGSLLYERDDGHQIEVFRNFDRRHETIQVYDRTHAREITGNFEKLRNREVDFAGAHLGLSKDVFLNVATIGHFSLENLGDRDALDQIREKLLSLADTGDESNSAEAALKRLQVRISSIGQPGARTKPLPVARARLAQLDEEYQQAQQIQRDLAGVAEQRRALLEEMAGMHEQRRALEEELRLLEAHDRAGRMRQANTLQARIDAATQHCFALGAARDFPLERAPEMMQIESRLSSARMQLERTRAEHEEIRQQLETERASLGDEALSSAQDLPEAVESAFKEHVAALQRVRDRLTATGERAADAQAQIEEAQRAVAALPDFSRLEADPVEWLTQLASSFEAAVRSRNEECQLRERLRNEVRRRREDIAESEALFKDCLDFPEQAREHELGKRMHEEQIAQRNNYLLSLEGTREEVADRLPGLIGLAAGCVAVLGALLIAYFLTYKSAILLSGIVISLAVLYFVATLFYSRIRLAGLARRMAETRGELEAIERRKEEGGGLIDRLLSQAGCQTLRELEAIYDRYREANTVLSSRAQLLEEQEAVAAETEARVPQFLERLRETFGRVGESIADENDVQRAVGSIIARYQEYRETKRRLIDARAALDRIQAEQKHLTEAIARAEQELASDEAEIRAFLRANGFDPEGEFGSAAEALRAYRKQLDAGREQRARITLLEERARAGQDRLRAEEREVEVRERDLNSFLARARVASIEQWHTLASQAKEYREIWGKRSSLEEQLRALLRGQDIYELRRMVEADGDLPPASRNTPAQVKAAIEEVGSKIEERGKEETRLHIAMAERGAACRPLNEIEEERALAARRVQDLELELEAASYAMALIENIARDKHARIAPKLAARAGAHLAHITGGAYDELLLSRDLTISVRIPGTNRMNENPETTLSKGTVDQIYLALRLALVQSVSGKGESIPMLLDDPFANYDDARLSNTMKLLAAIAERHQILLFTCRQDVAQAAAAINAPIIRL